MSDTNNDTPIPAKVKEKTVGERKVYSVTLSSHLQFALEAYAKENKLSAPDAFRDLLEFRLFQLGKLPSWWYERGPLLRTRGGTRK